MNNSDPQASVEETLKELDELLPRLPDPKMMTNSQKDKEKKQLRERLKALNATPRSDWHREFANILQIEFDTWDLKSWVLNEHTIGEDAPRADFVMFAEGDLPHNV